MALMPAAVVTLTSTVPTDPAGAVAVTWVSVLAVTVAALAPNFTAVAPVRLVPVMTTWFVPASGPELGLMPVTVGGATMEYGEELALAVSDDVATARLYEGDGAEGLVAPGMASLTLSPALTGAPRA